MNMFERCLYFNSNALARQVEILWSEAYGEFGLTPSQAYILRLVHQKQGLIQQEIASELSLERSTVSRMIRNLEQKGYLELKTQKNNQKNKAVFPSQKTIEIADALESTGQQLYQLMQTTIGSSDLHNLVYQLVATKKQLNLAGE